MDLMRAVVINIRRSAARESSGNPLFAMLEELLSAEDTDIKKRNLEEQHGIKMTIEMKGANTICVI